jgi:hypothetical protein
LRGPRDTHHVVAEEPGDHADEGPQGAGRGDQYADAEPADEADEAEGEAVIAEIAQAYAVPRCWPGETFVILANGPSLTPAQVERVDRAAVRVIAIKEAVRLAPHAPVLYACDARWWKHFGPDLKDYAGLRYALEPTPHAQCLRNTGMTGLELDPTGLRTGKNSGFQSIGLARHLGADRILLLGFDMKVGKTGDHWFGAHRYPGATHPTGKYADFIACFDSIVEPLKAEGIEVINCTPDSALKCFPMMDLAAALEHSDVLA